MRIVSDAPDGALAPQTARAQETARAHGDERRETSAVPGSGDSVQISGLSAQILDSASTDDNRIASRVAALTALYARGEYLPDAAALSHALVSHALGAADGGK